MALKFKEPHIIKATYRIVTPMFIGDAEQNATGISPQSVKGALRFWWRALMWGKIRAAIASDRVALQHLHTEEAKLFGSSAENGQAAAFTLRVPDHKSISITRATDWPNGGNDPSGYLGLGLWETGSHAKGNFQPHRQYIRENQKFAVELITTANVTTEQQQQLRDALTAWGLFGGLGSRARRAFGAIAIETLGTESFAFAQVGDYQKAVSKLLTNYRLASVKQPPFSAFSNAAQFSIGNQSDSDARRVHAALGTLFKNYRGLSTSPVRGSKKKVFGMPYAGGNKQEGEARRASPLLFHVHPIGTRFVGATLFLPALFHHDQALATVEYPLAKAFLQQLPQAVLV